MRYRCVQAPSTDYVEVDTYEDQVWVNTELDGRSEDHVALTPADARAVAAELIAAAERVEAS